MSYLLSFLWRKNSDEIKFDDTIKDLSVGFSIQAKTSNQYWLILIIISIISIANPETTLEISLPFNLGAVNHKMFNSIITLMLCAVTIAYTSAFLQANRTRKLIQKAIDNIPESKKFVSGIHIQDIFDAIVTPTFNRVAPISQFLQGKNQFFGEPSPGKWNKYLGIVLYLLLKIISEIIIFVVPLNVLITNFLLFVQTKNQELFLGLPVFFYWLICLIAIGMFLILIVSDFLYIIKVLKRISNNNSSIDHKRKI